MPCHSANFIGAAGAEREKNSTTSIAGTLLRPDLHYLLRNWSGTAGPGKEEGHVSSRPGYGVQWYQT